MQERLLQLGAWLAANGEGIYGTKPYEGKLPDDVYGTRKGENVYVFPPCGSGPIWLEWKNPVREIVRLDTGECLEFRQTEKKLETTIPAGDRFPGRICLKLCERDG